MRACFVLADSLLSVIVITPLTLNYLSMFMSALVFYNVESNNSKAQLFFRQHINFITKQLRILNYQETHKNIFFNTF